jgi:ubiquinone/menaquinone biosynthesis C-methylase UbiE
VETGTLFCPRCHRDFPIEAGIVRFIRPKQLTGVNRRFARFYDCVSHVYFACSRLAFVFSGGEDKCRREVLDRLEATEGRLLEVSIGPGVNLRYLIGTTEVSEMFGLDISLGQLQRCRRYCRKRSWPVDLFLGMAEELPFKDGSFDHVFHIGGINFFSDKQKAIDEMIRVARSGTRVVIADESEKGAAAYEWLFPGFSRMFEGKRESVVPPVDLLPKEMEQIRVDSIWRGMGYCLEFRKP